MNSSQESKLKMYLALRILLRLNPSILSSLPNSAEFLNELDAAILIIQTNRELLNLSAKGGGATKNQLREMLENGTLATSRKVHALAKYAKDLKLMAESKVTDSYVGKCSDIELVETSKGMHSLATTHSAALLGYGLTEINLHQYGNDIESFETAIPDVRQKQVNHKVCTRLVTQGFKLADQAVENLDTLVEIVRFTQATFYICYKATRKVVKTSMITLAVKGSITAASTGLPLTNATISFSLNGDEEVLLVKYSSTKGGFNLKTLSGGVYKVIVTKRGYQPLTETIIVNGGETCQLNVKLVKIG